MGVSSYALERGFKLKTLSHINHLLRAGKLANFDINCSIRGAENDNSRSESTRNTLAGSVCLALQAASRLAACGQPRNECFEA